MSRTTAELLIKAQKFEDEDQHEKAYECYKSAHEADRSDSDTLHKLAISAQMLNRNEEAIAYWNMFMELNPADPLSYNQLLDLYFHDNKYEYYMTRAKLKTLESRLLQATDDYKKAIANTTDEKLILNARHLLAQTYEIINKPLQAIDEYLRILDFEHNEAVYLSLANLYYKEDKSAAMQILTDAVKQYPESHDIRAFLCTLYLFSGDYEKALEYATNDFDRIKALLMQGANDKAIELLQNMPDKKDAKYFALMAEYYYNTGDDEQTFSAIAQYEKLEPAGPLSNQMKALVYEKRKNDFSAHFNWGKYYIKKGEKELALNEFLSAHNENTSDTDTIKELIGLYESNNDDFAAAEFCEKLAATEKDNIANLRKLVNFYEKQGFQDKVTDYLTAIIEENPKDYNTLLKLGNYAESDRRIDDAIDYYEKYLKFAPSSDEKNNVNNKLDLLKNGNFPQEEGFLDKLLGFFAKK
jgi:tetratricopeptide (TPR) repeat protein